MTLLRRKIGLIGSGQIGSSMAFLAGMKDLGDVVLFDVVEGIPQGKSLDLNHSVPVMRSNIKFKSSNEYSAIKGCDVCIVTAGLPRKAGMSRDDLIGTNAKVMKSVGEGIKKYCPDTFIICITNPLDVMVSLLQKYSGVSKKMVCGMAGILDSARMSYYLADALDVAPQDVQAVVLGGHGDSMVPIQRFVSIGGIPLPSLIENGTITQEKVDAIIERTCTSGGEIVGLLKSGSAFVAPAAAAISMAESFLKDSRRIIVCAAYCDTEYSVGGYFVGVPTVIGRNGIEKIIELKLEPSEKAAFEKSVNAVKTLMNNLPKLE